MTIEADDVEVVLELFEESSWEDLDLRAGDLHLVLSKRPDGEGFRVLGHKVALSAEMRPKTGPAPGRAPVVSPPVEGPPPGVVTVRSPTLGTFFVAPNPGAPPFVAPGDVVGADDTLGIVEVMKLMNAVKAGIAGEVLAVCAANNEMVEYDRVLFWIRPAGS